MLKLVADEIWVFDVEWVPDPVSGRLAYGLSPQLSDAGVLETMWQHGGATPENPHPYLKTVLCRVVSIAAVVRKRAPCGDVALELRALPAPDIGPLDERDILERFLGEANDCKPQLVGYNSASADLPILMQRSLVHGLRFDRLCHRPDKPWEGRDYFVRHGDWHIDLKDLVSGWGHATPKLHELAASAGIPGKLGVDGTSILSLWEAGDVRAIVQYNECDALSTYLVWLRLAHLCGKLSTESFRREEAQLELMLAERSRRPGNEHLRVYLEQWERLREIRARGVGAVRESEAPEGEPRSMPVSREGQR